MTDRPLALDLEFAALDVHADQTGRTITGTVVPYGQFGNTSVGPATFLAGAFGDLEPDDVVLVRGHDDNTPIGRAVSFEDDGKRLTGTFRVFRTTAGDDALVEASERARLGLSVGATATVVDHDDEGRLVISAADLRHVGHVVRPAFTDSQVSRVAAAHKEHDDMTTQTTDRGTDRGTDDAAGAVTLTASQLDDVVARAVDAALDQRDEAGLDVSAGDPPADRTPHVEVNEPDITAGEYGRALILASQGDDDAQRLVEAALATSTVSQNSGVIPTPQVRDWIDQVRQGRPTIEALSRRDLPEDGMSFDLPRWVVKPITAETGESVEIATQATQIDDMNVQVAKIAGGNRLPIELVERSSPAYLEELIDALVEDFQQKSNAYAFSKINPGRTAGDDQHSVGATIHEQYTAAIGDAYANSRKVPDRSLGGLTAWKNVRNEVDSTGRPIYSAWNPSNSSGDLKTNTLRGEVEGLRFALETDAADTDLLVFPSTAARYYEQRGGSPVTVRLMQVSTLEWEVAVYGFLAVAVKHPKAFRWLTDTAPA